MALKIYRDIGIKNDRAGRPRYFVSYICPNCKKEIEVRKETLYKNKTGCCRPCKNKLASGTNSPVWQGYKTIPQSIFYRITNGARHRNIEIAISIKDVYKQWSKQKGRCYYTNIILGFNARGKSEFTSASLDRVNNALGYTKDNIVWVHKDINRMKSTLTHNRFVELCSLVKTTWEVKDQS